MADLGLRDLKSLPQTELAERIAVMNDNMHNRLFYLVPASAEVGLTSQALSLVRGLQLAGYVENVSGQARQPSELFHELLFSPNSLQPRSLQPHTSFYVDATIPHYRISSRL